MKTEEVIAYGIPLPTLVPLLHSTFFLLRIFLPILYKSRFFIFLEIAHNKSKLSEYYRIIVFLLL